MADKESGLFLQLIPAGGLGGCLPSQTQPGPASLVSPVRQNRARGWRGREASQAERLETHQLELFLLQIA